MSLLKRHWTIIIACSLLLIGRIYSSISILHNNVVLLFLHSIVRTYLWYLQDHSTIATRGPFVSATSSPTISKEWGPFMARGDQLWRLSMVRGDHIFCHRWSGGTISFDHWWSGGTGHRGDRCSSNMRPHPYGAPRSDIPRVMRPYSHVSLAICDPVPGPISLVIYGLLGMRPPSSRTHISS